MIPANAYHEPVAASPRLLVHGPGEDSTFAVRRRIVEGQAQWDRPVEGDEVYGMSSKGDVLTQLQSYNPALPLQARKGCLYTFYFEIAWLQDTNGKCGPCKTELRTFRWEVLTGITHIKLPGPK